MITPAYAAGFFDGEGTVCIIYTKVRRWKSDPNKYICAFKFSISIPNTNREVLEKFKDTYGGSISRLTRNPDPHKEVFRWQIAGKESQEKLLNDMLPFSEVKKRAIEIGLEYLSTCETAVKRITDSNWEKRISLFQELRDLNHRGPLKPPANFIPSIPNGGWNPAKRIYHQDVLDDMMDRVRAVRQLKASNNKKAIIDMFAEGKSTQQISTELGYNRGSVQRILREARARSRPWSRELKS